MVSKPALIGKRKIKFDLPHLVFASKITAMNQDVIVLNGRYELIKRIGSGGMSIVYKARDRALGRLVAIKVLHESLTSDDGFLKRFQQEAHSAANLTHPNIVTVHDIGQDGYKHYIVMEFVDGKTLKQVIKDANQDGRFMPASRALDLIIQVCHGIGYAHRASLVHCDVKPQNMLVTSDDRVKVADFGIARAVSSATQQQIISQVWGTPQYFSPEQASGDVATPASDVYAIGIVLFEMLTGRLPFKAESHTAMALKHLQTPPPMVTEFNALVPQQLANIVNKVLSKEPAARYRTAGQLGRILSTYRSNSMAETGQYIVTEHQQEPEPSTPVSEQVTQIYERPLPPPPHEQPTKPEIDPVIKEGDTPVRARQPVRREQVTDPVQVNGNNQEEPETDWTAITIGIAALVALLGLIPLWWMVYLAWTQ